MNFLFVDTNPEHTGATTHFIALARAMAEGGHQVSAVVHPGGMICRQLRNSLVQLYPATFRNVFDLRGYTAVVRAARKCGANWLVGNSGKEYWPLMVIGRLLRVPVVLFRHRAPGMKRTSAFLVSHCAQRLIAASAHARQAYLERGIPACMVRVLYNSVDMHLCRPDPALRRTLLHSLDIADDAIVLGYVGRLQTGKGIFTLLQAVSATMASEPKLHCLWLGDGPEARALRARVATDPGAARHHFLGWQDDAQSWYSALSMLAFPSIAPETFGRVSIEAQAAGVPVLASNIGGIPETLRAGVTGMLLPPGDVGAWRDAIAHMCDPSLRATMGAAGREFVQTHFSTTVIAEAFVRLLKTAG